MWIIFFYYFILTHSFVSNITVGFGLNGGTITDFGTISLANIPNVSGIWRNPTQISVNRAGQIISIVNNTFSGSTVLWRPTNIILNQGRIISAVPSVSTRCQPGGVNSTKFVRGTTSFVFTSGTPTIFLDVTFPSMPQNSVVIFSGLISVTSGTATVGLYNTNDIMKDFTYGAGATQTIFIFLQQQTTVPSTNVRISVSGGTATLNGPFTLRYFGPGN